MTEVEENLEWRRLAIQILGEDVSVEPLHEQLRAHVQRMPIPLIMEIGGIRVQMTRIATPGSPAVLQGIGQAIVLRMASPGAEDLALKHATVAEALEHFEGGWHPCLDSDSREMLKFADVGRWAVQALYPDSSWCPGGKVVFDDIKALQAEAIFPAKEKP